jgi:IS5 family transposase
LQGIADIPQKACNMIGKNRDQNQGNLFSTPLRNLLNPRHELYQLADAIDWKKLEDRFAPLYSHTGRPSAPIRLMVSLLLLKQIDNLGDETVVAKWVENPYYQYFSGMDVFQWKPPIDPTDLVKFRQRIGQEGVELIFKASVDLHGDLASEDEIVADTTVQEKAIRYPTDARLYSRVIEHCRRINLREGLPMRQSYVRTVPKLMRQSFNAHHPRRRKKANRARRKLKTIAGRMVRELERNLSGELAGRYAPELAIFKQVIEQTRHSKDKIYAVHAPEVACIAKGKAHPRYEFGSKVSIATTKTAGIIVAVENFTGNPYDGDTLAPTLEVYKALHGCEPKLVIADRGYRGRKQINNTRILTPTTPRGSDTPYHKRKMRQQFRRRTAIEPRIGHLKSRFRLNRNWLKGAFGDRMNLFLSAAAWNIKKWMNSVARASFNRIWVWVRRLVEPVALIPAAPWAIMVPRLHQHLA